MTGQLSAHAGDPSHLFGISRTDSWWIRTNTTALSTLITGISQVVSAHVEQSLFAAFRCTSALGTRRAHSFLLMKVFKKMSDLTVSWIDTILIKEKKNMAVVATRLHSISHVKNTVEDHIGLFLTFESAMHLSSRTYNSFKLKLFAFLSDSLHKRWTKWTTSTTNILDGHSDP